MESTNSKIEEDKLDNDMIDVAKGENMKTKSELFQKKLKRIKTERNQIAYIYDEKYYYRKERVNKNGEIMYRCIKYRDPSRCGSYFTLYNDKVIKANLKHCHEENLKQISSLITKDSIKNRIENNENIFTVTLKRIYEDIKIKNTAPENMPKFEGIKTQLYEKLNKNVPKDVEDINTIDFNSNYFKTLYKEKFLVYHDEELIILQSKIQAKIMYDNSKDVFIDGTFYSAPKAIYQIIIIRVNIEDTNRFATTGFALCKNKTELLYKKLLLEINKNINYEINKIFKPTFIHIDFELALSNAIINVWNSSEIKYCYFHYQQLIERKRKKFIDLFNNEIEIKELFKRIKTLPLIKPIYVKDVFDLIKSNNRFEELEEFLVYYEEQFFNIYDIKYWNYYDQYYLRTNNPCEGFNNKLNSFFAKKPTFYRLINVLAKEELLVKNEYEDLIFNGFGKICKLGGGDYYSCLIYYKDKDEEIKGNSISSKNKRLKLWYEASLRLP